MANDDEPLGFNLDIGKILRDATTTPRKRSTRRTTTSRSTSNDMDAALRRAVRVELEDVKDAIRDLAEEIVKLRRSNDELTAKVARLAKG
jgi:hypothetical protein